MPLPGISAGGLLSEVVGMAPLIVQRTATAAGATTGTIAEGGRFQVVVAGAGGDANNIILLPPPVVGTVVVLIVDATGLEVRTTAPSTVGINGGTGASAESAIPASTTCIFVCETTTNWKGLQLSSTAGTLAKVEVAA